MCRSSQKFLSKDSGNGVGRFRYDHCSFIYCQPGSLPCAGPAWGAHHWHQWPQGETLSMLYFILLKHINCHYFQTDYFFFQICFFTFFFPAALIFIQRHVSWTDLVFSLTMLTVVFSCVTHQISSSTPQWSRVRWIYTSDGRWSSAPCTGTWRNTTTRALLRQSRPSETSRLFVQLATRKYIPEISHYTSEMQQHICRTVHWCGPLPCIDA